MDRTFAEVSTAYRAWARAQDEVATPAPLQAAFDALRDAARHTTARVVGDARAWSNGLIDDAEFERAVMALAVALACDAWCQGTMGARAAGPRGGRVGRARAAPMSGATPNPPAMLLADVEGDRGGRARCAILSGARWRVAQRG